MLRIQTKPPPRPDLLFKVLMLGGFILFGALGMVDDLPFLFR